MKTTLTLKHTMQPPRGMPVEQSKARIAAVDSGGNPTGASYRVRVSCPGGESLLWLPDVFKPLSLSLQQVQRY